MNHRPVPVYPIEDYDSPAAATGIHLARFEEGMRRLTNRASLHRHEYFEVFFLDGTGLHLNDFREHPIAGPTIIFVTPGQVHAWTDYTQLRGIMVAFTQEFFDGRCQPPSELLEFPFWYPEDGSPLLTIPDASVPGFHGILEELMNEFEQRAPDHENVIRWMLRTLFVRAARIFGDRHPGTPPEAPSTLVRNFRLMLESRFREVQKVSDYGARLGLSGDRLSELTKKHTGYSAGELIRQRLLLESQRLLAHTDLTMAEIAYDLNFQDPSYFSRFFRKQTGSSPGNFRSSVRDGMRPPDA
ncbi:AraC-like DNA-binding protein [Haloferula luteola]|uniref:AraC-like DNA-binding protein n=1 Tax=Haloferula luteola TaxID=595692 RepID=A0A840UYT8_9BACT|nr:helix-turn-helix domain-containing protein [Haloferula luteola]MBB5350173.1 AraC-like DNA-binding protein [Haloferula luteola]